MARTGEAALRQAALVSDTALEPGRSLLSAIPGDVHIPPLSGGAQMDLPAWERELERRLGRNGSLGTLDFLVDGEQFFPRFIAAVTTATDSVDVRAYIFDNDDVALTIAELLKRRSLEGIDVRVIIPLETDRGVITRNIALAANIMLEPGIRVYMYPGLTHAKAAIFDGWASVGSASLERVSLRINQEINIATSEPAAVQELLEELFLPDFEQAGELTEPFPRQWSDHLIEMFGDYVF